MVVASKSVSPAGPICDQPLAATEAPTLTVNVEEPPAVTDVGLKAAFGPAGETPALRFTVPAEPLVTAVLMVEVPLLP